MFNFFFGNLIQTYNNNHINNKDPNMLVLFSSVLEKLKKNNLEFSMCKHTSIN